MSTNDDDDDLDLDDDLDHDEPDTVDAQPTPDTPYHDGHAPGQIPWNTSPGGRIDLRVWPHTAQVFMNRQAAEELVRDLTTVLQTSAPTASVLLEYRQTATGTVVQISTDDTDPTVKTS